MPLKKILIVLSMILLSACSSVLSTTSSGIDVNDAQDFEMITDPQVSPQPTPTAGISPYSLEGLAARSYGEGELRVESAWDEKDEFTRYYITYDSDELNIYGYVNIPQGKGPFPVIIALHGYIPASDYETLDYSTRYADSIARKGYIVLHPNLRNFPPSDSPGRTRDYQAGYTIDVLNLLAHVRRMAGQEGSIFENADLENMGIWGHSLGGGVALRVVNLVPEIKAAVLYGAVSQRYRDNSDGVVIYNLTAADAAFSVHHGELDEVIDPQWSHTLCEQLEEAGCDYECFFYDDQPHTFIRNGDADPLFIQRTIDFYDRYLKSD